MWTDLLKDPGESGIVQARDAALKLDQPLLQGITRIGARNDRDMDARFGLAAAGDLRRVTGAKPGSTREREARQAFENGALTGGLVSHNNELSRALASTEVVRAGCGLTCGRGITAPTLSSRSLSIFARMAWLARPAMEAVLVVEEPLIVGKLLRIGGKRIWEGGLEVMENIPVAIFILGGMVSR